MRPGRVPEEEPREAPWGEGERIRHTGPGRVRCVLLLAFLLPALPLAAVGLWLLFLPWPVDLRERNPERTAFMEHRLEEARREGRELSLRHHWIPLEAVSPNLRRAVLAAEDDRFYQHRGIDWRALAEEVQYQGDTTFSWLSREDRQALREALRHYWANRDEIKGRSTITQQLAKNLYFTPERSVFRKVSEAVVTRRLERFLTKDRILEIYLNVAEWGPGIFGAQAAALAYFERGAEELTLEQAAALAATLPHPLSSNPSHRPARMAWRQEMLLARLRSPPSPPPDVPIPELPTLGAPPFDTLGTGGDTLLRSWEEKPYGAGNGELPGAEVAG
jgi:monofunctional glycosyltransferase